MRSFKKGFRFILVVLIFMLVPMVLDFCLYPCTFMRNDIHSVCTGKHDDIYLGTSHGKMNIDPDTVEAYTGRTGHNLCVGGEYAADAYYLTKLMIENGKPKRIVYEVDPGYFVTEKEVGNNYLLFYHEFPVSKAKAEYFADALLTCDFRTIVFPWYEYLFKYDIDKIPETIYQKWNHNYDISYLKGSRQEYHESGFIERYPLELKDIEKSDIKLFEETEVRQDNMEYLERLIELCRENDIQFIAVTTPIPAVSLAEYNDNYQEAWDYFSEFFAEQDVLYLNYNREYYDDFSHELSLYTDSDGHMNGDAAREYSKVLGETLDSIPEM